MAARISVRVRSTGLALASLVVSACGAPAATPAPAAEPSAGSEAAATPPHEVNPATGHGADAPEITRSLGPAGGVLVFYPRISPRADADDPTLRAIAQSVQQALEARVHTALPGRAVDVRPAPERVCPRAGCTAMTVGATVTRTGSNACAVVAVISAAGAAPQRLIPWVGEVRLRRETAAFREPPESQIQVTDFASCATIAEHLGDHADAIDEALRTSAPPAPH